MAKLPCIFAYSLVDLPYFFGYKTKIFFFQNNTKDLDLSCKTVLDHLGLFRKGKIGILANFHRTDSVI